MSADAVLDAAAAVCLTAGAMLSLAAGVALIRFPDVVARMHAATKPQVLGLLLVLTGCALRIRTGVDITTLVLVAGFQLATSPVAAHMVSRAAYRDRQLRHDLLVTDELAGADPNRPDDDTDDDDEHGGGDGDGPGVRHGHTAGSGSDAHDSHVRDGDAHDAHARDGDAHDSGADPVPDGGAASTRGR